MSAFAGARNRSKATVKKNTEIPHFGFLPCTGFYIPAYLPFIFIYRESRNEPTNNCRRVGDLVLKHLNHGTLEHYYRYIDTHIVILDKIQQSLHKINRFEQIYTDFEMQKVIFF